MVKIVCIDYSGSTGNQASYWNKVYTIVSQNKDASFVFWDTNLKKQSLNDVLRHCSSKKGYGGTDPSCIARWIKTLEGEVELIIITDGQIGAADVERCDQILSEHPFLSVTVHFLNTGGRMNLSVSSAFTRKTEKVNIYVDDDCLVDNMTLGLIDLTKYHNNPTLFVNESEALFKQIVLTNLGKANINLRNDLLNLQKNLIHFLANNQSNTDEFDKLRQSLINQEYAIDQLRQLIVSADSNLAKKIESIIQEMINQCANSTNFSFDLLQPGRLIRSAPVKNVEELPEVISSHGFECPILFDQDLPVLMINNKAPILIDLEKGYLDAIMTNPFLLLDNPELVQKLIRRFDHVVGLSAFRVLFGNHRLISPFTRLPISSLISTSNEKSHNKATNYALANIFFGKKLIGVPELWLSVVYFALKQVEYLADFLPAFTQTMIERMKCKRTNITLSGLPIEPLIKAPVDIAIWYCIISPDLKFTDHASNRLRSFGNSSRYLIELVDLFNYPYDKPLAIRRLNCHRAFAWMMNEEKNNTAWYTRLRAQFQRSIEYADGTVILLDGPALEGVNDSNNSYPQEKKPFMNYFDLSLEDLLALAHLVDRHKTLNAVDIDDFHPVEPRIVINYGYPSTFTIEDAKRSTPIDPETFRPYLVDPVKNEHWLKCAEEIYGPINKQLSGYNYFCKYVQEYGAYPTKEDFIKYLSERQANRETPFDTLPGHTLLFIDTLFSDYEAVLGINFADVQPDVFISRAFAHMSNHKNAERLMELYKIAK